MATSVKLVETLALTLGMNISTCANAYKELQAAALVSRGGRGRHAKKPTASDAIKLLFAVNGSEHIKDAADAARRYSALQAKFRTCAGDQARDQTDAAWYFTSRLFPRLGMLPRGHSLLDACVALVESYPVQAGDVSPTIKLSMRGPTLSATILIEEWRSASSGSMPLDFVFTEQLDYGPTNARDMFRTILDKNPVRQRKRMVRGEGDLRVEKHISNITIAALGDLLRD